MKLLKKAADNYIEGRIDCIDFIHKLAFQINTFLKVLPFISPVSSTCTIFIELYCTQSHNNCLLKKIIVNNSVPTNFSKSKFAKSKIANLFYLQYLAK